ncbi:MAG: S-layer homology domain-containing protein, partial [Clostridia bacterium]|nr:S-layer homology domain-containing protein [Clostridia bacterium]
MKNLKKLISVIIAVIMIVGSFATVSAADYVDVESTNSYYKAIQVLSGLGIAKGDEAGNFNPTADVKRSEMVTFICRAMGEEDIANGAAGANFTDVAANHWAAGYIAWGVNRGIINGMGDGTFAPDAPVKYQDAVVMIMRALGYDRIAQRAENGGYPTGYLKVASQRGVLTGAGYDSTKAATREIIAQLINNALTAPIVEVSTYGLNPEDDRYIIHEANADGYGLKCLLSTTNKIYRVRATVTDSFLVNPDLIKEDGNVVAIAIDKGLDYPLDIIEDVMVGDLIDEIYAGESDLAKAAVGEVVELYIAED